MRVLLSIAALASLLVAACSSTTGPAPVASSPAAATSPAPVPASEPAAAGVPLRAITEDGAFDEGTGNRDPFRSFAAAPAPPPEDTRPRKARRVPVDQLKLVGLVTHTATPRAMLVDANGKGYIVTQGELVGRPEPAGCDGGHPQSPCDGARFASFRVDRIREGDVVLVREDPSRTGNPGATRVLALPREPLLQADD